MVGQVAARRAAGVILEMIKVLDCTCTIILLSLLLIKQNQVKVTNKVAHCDAI